MKIKYGIIKRLAGLTNKEWDLLLYIGMRQDEAGALEGLYYRDALKATGMCRQSFYASLYALARKGVIQYERLELDYNVRILDNDFTDKDYSAGYINLNRKVFRTLRFKELKAHEKFLLLDFLKITHENSASYQVGRDYFFEKYTRLLGVTTRVIRGYLRRLRKFFSIGIKDKKYFITYLHSVFRDRFPRSEELQRFDHCVKRECWRKHIAYGGEAVRDASGLVGQYKALKNSTEEMLETLYAAIRKSVEGQPKKERALNARYVHKCLKEAL